MIDTLHCGRTQYGFREGMGVELKAGVEVTEVIGADVAGLLLWFSEAAKLWLFRAENI